jgi:hypothetical protein
MDRFPSSQRRQRSRAHTKTHENKTATAAKEEPTAARVPIAYSRLAPAKERLEAVR